MSLVNRVGTIDPNGNLVELLVYKCDICNQHWYQLWAARSDLFTHTEAERSLEVKHLQPIVDAHGSHCSFSCRRTYWSLTHQG